MDDKRINSNFNKSYSIGFNSNSSYSKVELLDETIQASVPHAANQANNLSNKVDEMELSLKLELLPINDVAKEVVNGKWGNGAERKERLEEAGYNVAEVQGMVNEILTGVNTYIASEPIIETKDEPIVEPLIETSSTSNSMESKRNLMNKNNEFNMYEFPMKEIDDSIDTDVSSQTFVSNTSKGISNLGDKVSKVATQVTYEEDIKNVSTKVDNSVKSNQLLADISQDEQNGFLFWKEKTTLLDLNGSRIVYEERKKLKDGSIEYYSKKGTLIKRINTDGTVVYYPTIDGADYYYNSKGEKIDSCSLELVSGSQTSGSWIFDVYGRDVRPDKVVVLTDATKEYYNNDNKLLRVEMPDGTLVRYTSIKTNIVSDKEVYYLSEETKRNAYKEVFYPDGTHIVYDSHDNIISQKFADGSQKEYSYHYLTNQLVAIHEKTVSGDINNIYYHQ